MDPRLQRIAEKVDAGQRLDPQDGLTLLESRDVWSIGQMADTVRRRLHGRTTFYNVNLSGSQLGNVSLAGARIDSGNITGLTIYGIEVEPFLIAELDKRAARRASEKRE